MKLKAIFTINSNLMKNKAVLLISMLIIVFNGVSQNDKNKIKKTNTMANTIVKTNEEWKKLLSPEQYNVLREKGTEMPLVGNTTFIKKKACMDALPAVKFYLNLTQNLMQAADGQAFRMYWTPAK